VATVGGSLRVGVVTTRGNVRKRNEDNFYVPGRPSLQNGDVVDSGSYPGSGGQAIVGKAEASESSAGSSSSGFSDPGPPGLFIVADGMGGQLAGERASQLAVELIPTELKRRLDTSQDEKALVGVIREAVASANEEILAQSHLQPQYASMGSTVCLTLFRKGRAFVAGIGDSRVYHVRDGDIKQLTKDHSLAHALGEAGTISPEEVENHKFKNILYLYLGSKDVGSGPEDVRVIEYRTGDFFLLASDGLTGVVKDETILEVLKNSSDPQRAAQSLVNRALENQSKDNVTCLVIQVAGHDTT
jgi:protein phosphatase